MRNLGQAVGKHVCFAKARNPHFDPLQSLEHAQTPSIYISRSRSLLGCSLAGNVRVFLGTHLKGCCSLSYLRIECIALSLLNLRIKVTVPRFYPACQLKVNSLVVACGRRRRSVPSLREAPSRRRRNRPIPLRSSLRRSSLWIGGPVNSPKHCGVLENPYLEIDRLEILSL
jgi:hypothetical protein